MSFFPIVERELRVATRKRSTAWLRVVAALIALVIGSGFLTLSVVTGMGMVQFGRGLFGTLTWLALATALGAGLFFTADCLSGEKRDGTLGFLFLTDLRGLDVAGGKLFATSLRASYALVAIFPVLAVTLLMGGVTGGQIWRSSLAILNALFCSLVIGLLVSSVSRDSQRALAGTFVLILVVCALGPLLDPVLVRLSGLRPRLSYTSPAYAFWAATVWGRSAFWPALCVSHILAWLALGLSGVLVRRTWQDRPISVKSPNKLSWYGRRYGAGTAREAKRRKLLDPNPVVWLALRTKWQSVAVWVLAGVVLCSFSAVAFTAPSVVWIVWSQVSWIVVVGLYLGIASQACRFFVEARRSGLLEVLLVTPLRSGDIVHGQWQAFLRAFSLPLFVLVLVQGAGALLTAHASFSAMSTAGAGVGWLLKGLLATGAALCTTANLVALIWVGMWMGLTTHTGSMATLKTLIFVEVLPALVIYFASTILAIAVMFGGLFRSGWAAGPSNSAALLIPFAMGAIGTALTLAKDAALCFWARKNLRERFRTEAARIVNPPHSGRRVASVLPVVPPIIAPHD
jgi:hypothetical protein